MSFVPQGYTLGKRLHSTVCSEVFEAVRRSDGLPVVVKSYLTDLSDDADARAQREFDALRRVQGARIPRAIELFRSDERPLLVLERLDGISLEALIQEGPLDHELWLDLAIELAETLEKIHAARLLHRDLTPSNILVAPNARQAWIVDFGRTGELGSSESGLGMTGTVQRALQYMAPEQTGRMNRGCDYRTDLYSLGAALYSALTGRAPFVSSDPLELIHAHIARVAPTASAIHRGVPEAFSDLLEKLLQKEPEDRYQSAGALHADLLAFRDQISRSGRVDPGFVLGAADAGARPLFSPRLYGREHEITCLREAYRRCARGTPQLVLLSGEPGAGKSALVDELRKTVTQGGGYLAGGKFDQYRDRAYGGWVSALDSLAQQVLVESDVHLQRWRRELSVGIGTIAQALVDLVPDLGFILGELPPIPVLGPRETQARLSLALQRWVAAFATPDHPLVLFLDDLQWSDPASRLLLEELLGACTGAALLVICAYRANEVDAAHPFAKLIERLERRGVGAEHVRLGPLSLQATTAMLAEALDCAAERVASLAEIVGRKTGHSPLLVHQLVDLAYENGWLHRHPEQGWVWDADRLESSATSEGAVALLTARIDLLQPEQRAALQFASCVGDAFDLAQLCELSGRPNTELEGPLHALLQDGFISPAPQGFRFAHDRIREAAQLLLPAEERALRHYQVGRQLLDSTPEAERPQRALDIVEHMNRGIGHVPEELRLTLAQLNHRAGSAILAKGAAVTARDLLAVGCQLFRADDWREHGTLGFELHLASAEAEFQSHGFEVALALLDDLDRRSLTRLQFTQVAVKRAQILAVTSDPAECTRYALSVLRQLGIRWPLHPSRARVWLALKVVRLLLRGRNMDHILRPAQFDPRRFCPLLLLPVTGASFLRVDVGLTVLSVCVAMRRYIRFGYLGRPGFLLANYATFSHLLERDAKRARRAAETAMSWSARVPDPVYDPRAELMISAGLSPWLMPRREALAPLARLSVQAREVGDPEFAYYARFLDLTGRALAGDPIEAMERGFGELRFDVQRAGHWYPESEAVGRVYGLVRDGCPESALPSELAECETWIHRNPGSAATYVRTFWMLVLCVHGRYDLALQQSEALGDKLHRVVPFVHVADHLFYRGLACAALATTAVGRSRRRLRSSLQSALRQLLRWADDGPDFVHMATLLQAELKRLHGDLEQARLLYRRAARRAREQHFVHHAALAHERFAALLVTDRRPHEAAELLKEAIALYSDWGSRFKVGLLSDEHHRLKGDDAL